MTFTLSTSRDPLMLDALIDAVTRYTDAQPGANPFVTAIDGLTILRSKLETRPNHLIHKPALCIVVQGAKSTTFGNRRFDYKAGQALVVSIETPAFGRVIEASPAKPFLGIVIELNLSIMREVMETLNVISASANAGRSAVFVANFDGPLADCALRMVRLLDTPQAIPTIYPLLMREISYWLLSGPSGGEIARLALAGSHSQRVMSAIHALRERFAESISIEDLARAAQMSPSAFHREFKAITSMTPLQYQKQLRLLEARRLMATDATNVETAAFQVGYESASQFSREYSRMFGAPPRREMVALKRAAS
jgi:AraC-like DNA-binding protein